MLELPESTVLASQLEAALKEKQIVSVKANSSPHGFAFYSGDPQNYPEYLEGKQVSGVSALAGLIEMQLEEYRLVFGDGINLRYFSAEEKYPDKHQLMLQFSDGSVLVAAVQMYGGIWAFIEGSNDNPYYLAAKEKPSPLQAEFDRNYFTRLFYEADPKLSLKAFLATQQRIPGLGNGCLQDVLFCAKLHPKTKLSAINEEDVENLFCSLKQTLAKMTEQGGRNTEKDLFGKPGGYRTVLSKNTWKSPCPVCGGEIVKQPYMGGTIYFCPHCQPQV